jgi:hypothetical protein
VRGRQLAVGTALCAALALAALSGCGDRIAVDPRTLPTSEVSGEWDSALEVGSLGKLHLELSREGESRVYDAVLTSAVLPGLGESDGIGTLADGHLILDFGTGQTDEYYFEGHVVTSGNTITSIDGQLVFPDQTDTLPVSFDYTGPLPASP